MGVFYENAEDSEKTLKKKLGKYWRIFKLIYEVWPRKEGRQKDEFLVYGKTRFQNTANYFMLQTYIRNEFFSNLVLPE